MRLVVLDLDKLEKKLDKIWWEQRMGDTITGKAVWLDEALPLIKELGVPIPAQEQVNGEVEFGKDRLTGTLIFANEMKKSGRNDLIDFLVSEVRKKYGKS